MNNNTTEDQDRISQLYADNKAAFQAAQESANKGDWQSFEKTLVANDTPAEWIYWTPERDGHAPDDWVEKQPVEYLSGGAAWLLAASPQWNAYIEYRYRPLRMELKPCPFCGGEAQRFTLTEEDEPMNAGGDVITCTKCQASSHVEFGRKENLAECWNTRTTSLAAQDGLVEAVADALLSAFLAGRGSITARERNAHKPEPSMEHFRNIALSAIKGDKS